MDFDEPGTLFRAGVEIQMNNGPYHTETYRKDIPVRTGAEDVGPKGESEAVN